MQWLSFNSWSVILSVVVIVLLCWMYMLQLKVSELEKKISDI